jgi:hypothetical protein
MVGLRRIAVLLFSSSALLLVAAGSVAQNGPEKLSADGIVSRMEQAQWSNPARTQPYILTRDYQFFQGGAAQQKPKSEVVAQVNFNPPNEKTFAILETHGSGRGEMVVKHLLENESQNTRDVTTVEFTRRNYDFALLGEYTLNGRRCYVLELRPRRQERSLFNGKAYVAQDDFRLLRVEGEPAKNPSWWLKSSYVVLDFGDVDGLWLPVASHGSGDVRLFGHFSLESKKIGQQVGGVVAMNEVRSRARQARTRASHLAPASNFGTAVAGRPQQ